LRDDEWTVAKEALPFHAITPFVRADRLYFASRHGSGKYQIYSIPLSALGPKARLDSARLERNNPEWDEASYAATPDGQIQVFCRRSKRGDYDIFELRDAPWENKDDFALTNILFRTSESAILPESNDVLDRLAAFLKRTDRKILVIGHTDKRGSPDANLKLSFDRARAVKQALVDRGVSQAKILTDGKGQSQPISTENTEEAFRQNRRTEFKLSEK